MNDSIALKIYTSKIWSSKMLSVIVDGQSMLPVLKDGDIVQVQKKEKYVPGDILVFLYKYGRFVIHRLLFVRNGCYYCKGDNSFRLEDLLEEQILGKVVLVKREENFFEPPQVNDEFLQCSYRVNREFRKLHYDSKKILESEIYIKYKEKYLTERKANV